MARLCDSLTVLRDQIGWEWPGRSIGSDGWIGDADHKNRTSDHNPNTAGVVRAIDVTHDTDGGPQGLRLAERLRTHRDPRIKYVIYDKRMFSHYTRRGYEPFEWRAYTGANPHVTHVHISVRADPELYDNDDRWEGFYTAPAGDARLQAAGDYPPIKPADIARKETTPMIVGKKHPNRLAVRRIQQLLTDWDPGSLPRYGVDGDYGNETATAVKRFQKRKALPRTGTVDPDTLYWLVLQPPRKDR